MSKYVIVLHLILILIKLLITFLTKGEEKILNDEENFGYAAAF